MGFPDRARRAVADAVALARRRGHHMTVAYAVFMTGHLAELMDEWECVRNSTDEADALTTEWGLSGLADHIARRGSSSPSRSNCDRSAMDDKRRHPQPGFARTLHDGMLARALGVAGCPMRACGSSTNPWSGRIGQAAGSSMRNSIGSAPDCSASWTGRTRPTGAH